MQKNPGRESCSAGQHLHSSSPLQGKGSQKHQRSVLLQTEELAMLFPERTGAGHSSKPCFCNDSISVLMFISAVSSLSRAPVVCLSACWYHPCPALLLHCSSTSPLLVASLSCVSAKSCPKALRATSDTSRH